jgi:HECT-domain (ubiquitin-transferase)
MGGLTKEWFQLLIREIFQPDYGYSFKIDIIDALLYQIRLESLSSMFIYYPNSRCYWFSTSQENNLKEYNLIGVLMGLAVYNRYLLPVHIRHYPISLSVTEVSISPFALPSVKIIGQCFMNALGRQFISRHFAVQCLT